MKDYTLGNNIHFMIIKSAISSAEQEVVLGGREAKLLELFCEKPNQVLDKTHIMSAVWGNVIVSETSLTKAISNLRKSLTRFNDLICEVKTIPKEGYMFILENRSDNWNIADNILKGDNTIYNKNILRSKLSEEIIHIDSKVSSVNNIRNKKRNCSLPLSSLLIINFSISLVVSVITYTFIMIINSV